MTPEEFGATFREYQTQIAKYLARRANFEDVEDLCSEVFEIAYRKRESSPAGFELPWLYRIAGFVIANHRRKINGQNRLIAAIQVADDSPSAESIAIADLTIASAWKRLTTAERGILSLVAFEGLRVDEAAKTLSISSNAASIRLHRARTKLAEFLNN